MFSEKIYLERRRQLKTRMGAGVLFFPGNDETAMNYAANTFHFRQDSTFLYYFGIDEPNLSAVIDCESGEDILFADEFEMEDIIWMGRMETFGEKARKAGIRKILPAGDLNPYLEKVRSAGRAIHYLPPYRYSLMVKMQDFLGIGMPDLKDKASPDLIRAVVEQRSVKSDEEIAEIEKALDTTYIMHTAAMRLARPGMVEQKVAGHIEGIALSGGGGVSFPVILSVNVQILHNHRHGNIMKDGDLLVNDSGAESNMHYAADITRTFPVNGRFSARQREIYEIVLKSQLEAINSIKPGIRYKEIHLKSARIIAAGLKDLGLMKGDPEEAVALGAHALFFPHGLGHMMGLDVHDMENLGEDYVGYDDRVQRSEQFGLAYLRLARRLQPGFVLTVEPGLYFIPELIAQWKSEKKFPEFINYEKVDHYLDFSGVRIEDDVLVTETAARVLGKPIPKTIAEVEAMCQSE